jgi:hypothetical protein
MYVRIFTARFGFPSNVGFSKRASRRFSAYNIPWKRRTHTHAQLATSLKQ